MDKILPALTLNISPVTVPRLIEVSLPCALKIAIFLFSGIVMDSVRENDSLIRIL